jgi:hypothetical protein
MKEMISVKDKLPPIDKDVLVWDTSILFDKPEPCFNVAIYGHDEMWFSSETLEMISGVTHWMPLPKQPTKE